MTEGALEVDGARLAYRVDGSGPDVVLIHAGVADMRMWDPVVAELDGRLHTIRLDLRGFGRHDRGAARVLAGRRHSRAARRARHRQRDGPDPRLGPPARLEQPAAVARLILESTG